MPESQAIPVPDMPKGRTIPLPEEQPLVDLWSDDEPCAAKAMDIGRSSAYALAAGGEFPIEVLRIGGLLKVRTADLRRYLGLDAEGRAS